MAYSSEKIPFDGMIFDSKSELEYYKILKSKKENKEIKDFECSPKYILQESDWLNWRGEKQSSIDHYPDYLVTLNSGEQIILDTKGGGTANHNTDAKIKKLIFEYLNREIPYYYISKLSNFLGGDWVESSPRHDFYTKIRNKYKKIYPNENPKKKWATCKKFTSEDWGEYFDFVNVDELFYIMKKEYTKKDLEKISKMKTKVLTIK